MTRPILFSSGPPSNFYRAPIVLCIPKIVDLIQREHEFKGTEWWFQAYKVAHVGGSLEQYLEIADASTATEAKKLGRRVSMNHHQLQMWDKVIAPQAMLEGCLAKFWQNEYCYQWLVETGDATLIEHRPDPIWGDNIDGTGRNLLGHVLMLVRATIR